MVSAKGTALVVVGLQYGDEGKGKIVDGLAQGADVVIRYNGGANAGHTVINDRGTFKLHLVPSGIFNPGAWCLLGNGAVVDPESLVQEMAVLLEHGVTLDKFRISDAAHVVMPWHRVMDKAQEIFKGAAAIGTTGRGIGPCYVDKVARVGIRMGELRDLGTLKSRVERLYARKLAEICALNPDVAMELPSVAEIMGTLTGCQHLLVPHIAATDELARDFNRQGKNILLEAAQGTLIDLEVGTYPYVTSSYATSAGACLGSGLPPNAITDVIGVAKAYTTRVGNGPFPGELCDDLGEKLRQAGNEFGTTTGRPRRCGWFNAAEVRRAAMINGCDEIVLTKLDVLSGFERIGIVLGDSVPDNCMEWQGWCEPIAGIKDWKALPDAAKRYVNAIERFVGVPIGAVSTGAHRDDLITPPALTEREAELQAK